jgi:hypothetical protein
MQSSEVNAASASPFAARIRLSARALRLASSAHHSFGGVKEEMSTRLAPAFDVTCHVFSTTLGSLSLTIVSIGALPALPHEKLHYRTEHLH